MEKKAVIVLSGGLDSATCMGIAKDEGYKLYPITFSYGQRHTREVEQARKIGEYFTVTDHKVIEMSFLHEIGGSALTDTKLELRTSDLEEENISKEIPLTYVPARNMIFLALAAAYAEVIGAERIFIGVSAVDYSGYPDCRPDFISSMEQTINLGTKFGTKEERFQIEAPLQDMSKAETILQGVKLNVPYHLTTSCYQGREKACGVCDSCQLRIKGFKEAGIVDPISYEIDLDWGDA